MRSFKVPQKSAGQRADVFVADKFPKFSRSSLERLFEDGFVMLDGKKIKPGQKLKAGGQLKVDDKLLQAEPEAISIPVIYEDDNVVVIDKPAGVLTHSKGALNTEGTVASFLKAKITDKKLTGNRAGIVHRLDRATSGVIIGAKTESAQKQLQKQFSNRKTKKTYLAIVEGVPEPAEAIIDAPIERNPKKPQTFRTGSNGRPAQTHYQTLRTFKHKSKSYSLLGLRPTTGRTHQLRVHLKHIGHPIVGDSIYGTEDQNMMLHALSLELTLPGSERKVFSTEPPDYFKAFTDLGK